MLKRDIRRRQFLVLASAAAGAAAVAQTRAGATLIGNSGVPGLLDDFLALPGAKSAQLDVDAVTDPWHVTHDPNAPLFCGGAFKTFVLAIYVKEVEAGRLSESEQLTIDDSVRSGGGGVFERLTGTTEARNVLEAMIAHSDNTATNVALHRFGRDKVRAFMNTPAYLKGGSIDWNGFHYLAVAGQMIVAATPVTFCRTLNWTDSDGEKAAVEARYKQTVAEIFAAHPQAGARAADLRRQRWNATC